MAIVVVAMIGIVLTAAGVLGAVYLMHQFARSPRMRARVRRRAFAVVADLYGVRRQLGYRFERAAASSNRWLRTFARTGIDRARGWAGPRRLGMSARALAWPPMGERTPVAEGGPAGDAPAKLDGDRNGGGASDQGHTRAA